MIFKNLKKTHRLIANLILLIVVMTFSQCCPSQTRTSPNLPSPLGAEIQSGLLGSECLGGPNPGLGHPIGTYTLARNPSKNALLPWKKKTRGAQEELFTLVINAKLQSSPKN
jgi:hypothetical protein